MAGDNNDHLKLPNDLLIEIFIQCSVKSLLRVKCVCKQWYVLIKNPQFTINHLQYQKRHNKGRMLLQYMEEDLEETSQYNYALFDHETPARSTYNNIHHFEILSYYILHMEGPINGLYCLYNSDDRIMLWNPALKEFRALPLPHPHFFPHTMPFKGCIGFGTGYSTHDYKVVVIRNFIDRLYSPLKISDYPIYATLYNLTTSTCKFINCGHFYLSKYEELERSKTSSFLMGIYYWCTSHRKVIAFDMGKETFRQIEGPDIPYSRNTKYSLTIYNDKVAMLVNHPFSFDILVMLEEGVWIKQCSVTFPENNFRLFGVWKNDVPLVAIYDALESNGYKYSQTVLCNPNTQERIRFGPIGIYTSFLASLYYESLLSVNSWTMHKRKHKALNTITNFLDSEKDPYLHLYTGENDLSTNNMEDGEGEGVE